MLRLTLLQTDIAWLDPETNIARAARLMDGSPGSDLYVLPEMWASGFVTTPDYGLMDTAARALEWMHREADARGCAVAGSLAVRDWPEAGEETGSPAMWRNRFYFITPGGGEAFYDKRNLFTYGGEQLTYTPGTERRIVAWRGVRFMLQTCFDLRFPETGRNRLRDAYDVLLYVANWPASRRNAWDTLLTARAIENQACCVGVNRTGTDPQCLYDGGSAAIDAYGHALLRLDSREQAATFALDLERQRQFRAKFHVLK